MGCRIFLNIAISACLLFLCTGCERSPENQAASSSGEVSATLIRGNGGEPQTLDPSRADDVHAFNILYDLYEGLVSEAEDGSLVPGAAERWEISADGRQYRFFLRPDARWSNGEPITADHFVAGMRRGANPATASPYAFFLAPILNAEAVIAGDMPVTALGVRAEDELTLSLELERPAPHFLAILTMPIAYPFFGDIDTATAQNRFNDPASFVGNGAYTLVGWRSLDRIVLRRNPYYRDARNVAIEVIEYLPIENPHAELNRYRAGEIDITATVPPTQISSLRKARPAELRITPRLAIYYLAYDLTEPTFASRELRKALSMAIDREAIVDLLGRGELAAYGLVPPGVSGHTGERYAWKSLPSAAREKAAKRLYGAAGYSADNPLRMTLSYDAGDIHETVALAISSMWQTVLGAEIALESKEWKYYLSSRDDRDSWQVMRFAWFGDYNGASTFTDIFRSANPQNLPAYSSAAYDRLLDEAVRARDDALRGQLTARAERQLLDDYPIIPLYFFVSKHLVSPQVENFRDNVLDRHPSQYLRKTIQVD